MVEDVASSWCGIGVVEARVEAAVAVEAILSGWDGVSKVEDTGSSRVVGELVVLE